MGIFKAVNIYTGEIVDVYGVRADNTSPEIIYFLVYDEVKLWIWVKARDYTPY